MKTIYINAAVQYSDEWDLKELIPDANMRRRMSRIVKMGVSAGLTCLKNANIECPDSIITATAYGCLSDSEKFLQSSLSSNEQMLPPTPFIQSTFNTIGSHIAILTGCHGYNMTFVNREHSFTDALLDAMLEIGDGKHTVLLGLADEATTTLNNVINRMGNIGNVLPHDDSAWFFLLSDQKSDTTLGELSDMSLEKTKGIKSAQNLLESIQ